MESVEEQNYMMNFYHNEHNHKLINIGKDHVISDEENMYVGEEDSTSSSEFSNISKESSSSSLDLLDDDASSSLSSSPQSCDGPLYGLSKLMDQLPIKRGLSKYYQGKSQSYTSLARVTSLEDLAKKETPYQRRLKACRSYGGGLNNNNNSFKSFTNPKPTISKKVSNNKGSSLSNLSSLSRKNSFVISLPPLSHVHITF